MPQSWVLARGEFKVTATYTEPIPTDGVPPSEEVKRHIARLAGFMEPVGCGCGGWECLTSHDN